MKDYPLVSIVVITYHSREYVIDTLNSILQLTYKNIELVISDDGSNDDTVKVCSEWLKINGASFVNFKIITNNVNTGIPANCNRGIKGSSGEWIKLIAGDDLLVKDSVEHFVSLILNDPTIEVVYSKSLGFIGNISDSEYATHKFPGYAKFYSSDAKKQYKMLMRRNYCDGPTIFFKKPIFDYVGGFDEKFRFEDHPFALKLTKNNIKLYYLDRFTVYYRENIVSITRSDTDRLFSNFYLDVEKFTKAEIFPHCNILIRTAKRAEFARLDFFERNGINKKNRINRLLFLSTYYMNPLHIYNKFF